MMKSRPMSRSAWRLWTSSAASERSSRPDIAHRPRTDALRRGRSWQSVCAAVAVELKMGRSMRTECTARLGRIRSFVMANGVVANDGAMFQVDSEETQTNNKTRKKGVTMEGRVEERVEERIEERIEEKAEVKVEGQDEVEERASLGSNVQ
jgi:hypothetical protein